jgi:hypothetical protein
MMQHMNLSATLLAESNYASLFFTILIMLLVIAALISGAAMLRRKMNASDDNTADNASGFNLASLRQLVREGRMTPQEFEQAKAQIVEATQRAAERAKPINTPAPEQKKSE